MNIILHLLRGRACGEAAGPWMKSLRSLLEESVDPSPANRRRMKRSLPF